MNAQELTLNIAVNLGRLARWVLEGRQSRVRQFLKETDEYVSNLKKIKKGQRFTKTFELFIERFKSLKESTNYNEEWAEEALTWANILTHRAKLA